MALAVKVPKRKAEEAKRRLVREKLFDPSRKIEARGEYVFLPVSSPPEGYEVVEAQLEERRKRKGFEERLGEFLSPEEMKHVSTSFDLIGGIAILEVPLGLESRENDIAEALLDSVKAVRAVFKKEGRVTGRERVRRLRFLAGENRTETLHRENSIRLKLDIGRVYFSPRLSYERQRVASKVEDGEVIVDLFAGVGPFALLFARNRMVKVYAIDINASAVKYLEENIKLNRLKGEVVPLLGEASRVAPRWVADRVIMNLPRRSHEFLPLALEVLRKEGGVLHFYTLEPEEELFARGIKLAERVARKRGKALELEDSRVVRSYSPRRYHVAYDFRVKAQPQ